VPPAIVQPTTKPQTKAKWVLVILGFLLVLLFAGGLFAARWWGSTTVSKATPSSSTATVLTTTTQTKSLPSDTLLTAILATGAILVVVGYLYTRISAIKVPGAGEVDFITDDEKKQLQTKVQEAVAEKEKAAKQQVSSDQVMKVGIEATANFVEQKKQLIEGKGTAELLDHAVDAAVAKNL
jgi:flagellar basal body-associated protein FliL